tara:strand:- start:240 stop:494 length:255 start_codon:yes stop_codon:yes gene_type:complete
VSDYSLFKFWHAVKLRNREHMCDVCGKETPYLEPLLDWAKTRNVKKVCSACGRKINDFKTKAMHKFLTLIVRRGIEKMRKKMFK